MQEETKTRQISVTVPEYLIKLLDAEAKRDDRSRSYQMSQILAEHFKRESKAMTKEEEATNEIRNAKAKPEQAGKITHDN